MLPSILSYGKNLLLDNSVSKCELPKVIIRDNIGPTTAAKSRLLLLGQCRRLHRSSAGPTTAAFVDCLNWPTYTKPIVIFTMASSSENRRARVRPMDGTLLGYVSLLPRQRVWARIGRQVNTGVIIPATARYWQPIFGKFLAILRQCWAVSNFALGYVYKFIEYCKII